MIDIIECKLGESLFWHVTSFSELGVRGIASIYRVDDEVCSLVRVVVPEDKRGHGHGSDVVKAAITKARELGFKRMDCGPVKGDAGLVAFYQKFGFRMTSESMENGDPAMELFLFDTAAMADSLIRDIAAGLGIPPGILGNE